MVEGVNSGEPMGRENLLECYAANKKRVSV